MLFERTFNLLARNAICSSLSSADAYNTFFVNADKVCKANVDFPMPGLPPSKIIEPLKTPPPRTLSTSLMPIDILSTSSLCNISSSEWVSFFSPLCLEVLEAETLYSLRVPHSLQKGHWPFHFGKSCPHEEKIICCTRWYQQCQ